MPTINKARINDSPRYKKDNKSAKYYNSKQWRNLRNYYIKRNPLCEACLANGKVVPAAHVHHIVEFLKGITEQQRWQLLTDEDNLMSLCVQCHHDMHNHKQHTDT